MNTDDNEMFAVLYAGDNPAGTKDTWQLWTKLQLDHASNDARIIETHRLINWEQVALKWWKQGMTDAAEEAEGWKSAFAATQEIRASRDARKHL